MVELGWGHVALHVDTFVIRLAKERSSGDADAKDVEPTLGEVEEMSAEKTRHDVRSIACPNSSSAQIAKIPLRAT